MSTLNSIAALFQGRPRPDEDILPTRVRRLIEHEEALSERLIGWVQLFIVALFATLYLIAPRPADAPATMLLDPVPVGLAAYAAFTLARLSLAYRGRLPAIVLLVSILADVGLLLGIIWSFHAQYDQAAPFSLKVPTFVYLFVFIAIRVLRFDLRYVIAAGLAATVGWMLLVTAVLVKSGSSVVTRSFAGHLNGNLVLLGAEFDKIVTILLVTAVLAFAVQRGQRLFIAATRSGAAVADLRRFLGRGVSDTLMTAESEAIAGLAHERDAAILMLDIRGFTTLSADMPPQRIVEILTALHARVVPIVRAHNGIIDKFMGDGIMATFGAVSPSPTPAADALRALDAILPEARRWQTDLAGRYVHPDVAVHGAVVAGSVVFAVVGAEDRLEYTVIGEAVNLAAKLEKHNKVENTRALTTAATFALARDQGYVPAEPKPMRAKRQVAGTTTHHDLVVLG